MKVKVVPVTSGMSLNVVNKFRSERSFLSRVCDFCCTVVIPCSLVFV